MSVQNTPTPDEAFINNVNHLIEINDMTQRKLSNAIDIPEATLSRYMTAATPPSAICLYKIADYFNVSTDYLLGRTNHALNNLAIPTLTGNSFLSQGATCGFIDNINLFKKVAGKPFEEDINRFITEFLASPAIFQMMFSCFLTCLKKDQAYILGAVPVKEKKREKLQTIIEKFNVNYDFYLHVKYKELPLDSKDIIGEFCKHFESFIPKDERLKIDAATSVSGIAPVLRYSSSRLCRHFFAPNLTVISIWSGGDFFQLLKMFFKNLFNHLFCNSVDDSYNNSSDDSFDEELEELLEEYSDKNNNYV